MSSGVEARSERLLERTVAETARRDRCKGGALRLVLLLLIGVGKGNSGLALRLQWRLAAVLLLLLLLLVSGVVLFFHDHLLHREVG